MPSRDALKSDLDWLSERISNRVWVASTGVLATCVAFLFEGASSDNSAFLTPSELALPLAFSILAVLFDFLQYLVGWWQTSRLHDQMEAIGSDDGKFSRRSALYLSRHLFFLAKIGTCIVAVVWLAAQIALTVDSVGDV